MSRLQSTLAILRVFRRRNEGMIRNGSWASSSETIVIVAALWFVTTSNVSFWRTLTNGRELVSASGMRLGLMTALLLIAIHVLLLIPFSWRVLLKPVLTIHLIAAALTGWFIEHFHIYVDTSMIRNVMQTDGAEARELISPSLVATVLVMGVVPSVLLWLTPVRRMPVWRSLRRKLLLAVVALAMISIAAITSYGDYVSFFQSHHDARYLITPANGVVSIVRAALEESRGRAGQRIAIGTDARLGERWTDGARPVVFVLVVGETARAANFSLDGYPRRTNPLLETRDIVNFSRVSSCGTSTAESLPCMFSPFGRSDFTALKGRRYEGLLDVLRHAGLSVRWLENNSGCKGVCDGVATENLSERRIAGLCDGGECLDEVLLLRLRELLSESRTSQVIVLHQKGSHGPAYSERYPETFAKFRPDCRSSDLSDCSVEEIRNAYDNSILYTDHLLGEIILALNDAEHLDTAMLYVSDHGESLGEGGVYLHGLPYTIAPEVQKRVPMLLWTSDRYASRFRINRSLMLEREDDDLSHDHLFHTALGLLDVETRERNPALDLTSPPRVATLR